MVTEILVPIGRMILALPGGETALVVSYEALRSRGGVYEDLITDDLHGVRRFKGQQERPQNETCGKAREWLTGSNAAITCHRAT